MIVYTDGSSSPDRCGGWAWAASENVFASGSSTDTTNQRMEVKAAIEAIKANYNGKLIIVTDSRYLCDCINKKWYKKWRSNGWKNTYGEDVANKDLWVELLDLLEGKVVKFAWVKGHDGNAMNELADALAVTAKKELQHELRNNVGP